MAPSLSIIEHNEQHVLSIRTNTSMRDLPVTILHALARVSQFMEEKNILPAGPAFVGYYNLDLNDLNVEIGYPVSQPESGDDEIQTRTIPGGPAGVCLFTGPYQELATAYQQLNAYIESQGREPSGVSYEYYLNNPAVTPPDKLETRIVFPLMQPSSENEKRPQGFGRIYSLYW